MHSIASPKQSWTLPLDAAPGGTQTQARTHRAAPNVNSAAPPAPFYTLISPPSAFSLQAPKSAAHLARRQSRGNSPRRGAREPTGLQLPARTRARRTNFLPRARRTCKRRRRWGRTGPRLNTFLRGVVIHEQKGSYKGTIAMSKAMSKAARIACGTALLLSVDAFSPTAGFGRPSLVTSAASEAAPCVCCSRSSPRCSTARCARAGENGWAACVLHGGGGGPPSVLFAKLTHTRQGGKPAMGGLQAPVKCVCVRSQTTLGLRMADQVARRAACLGHACTRTHTRVCARVVSFAGMVCVRVQTEYGPDTAVFLVSQGAPVPWETRVHQKRSIPARQTSTTSTVVVCHSCCIALSSATALSLASSCTDMRLKVHLPLAPPRPTPPPHVLVCAARLPVFPAGRIR